MNEEGKYKDRVTYHERQVSMGLVFRSFERVEERTKVRELVNHGKQRTNGTFREVLEMVVIYYQIWKK